MTSLAKRLDWLQAPIGGFGFLVWMASFQASTWLRNNGHGNAADGASGYVLGFGTAFAAWIAIHIYKGNHSRFIEDHLVWKWFSILILVVIAAFGLAGFIIDIFANTSWQFNFGYVVGGFVMGACLGPVIDRIDNL